MDSINTTERTVSIIKDMTHLVVESLAGAELESTNPRLGDPDSMDAEIKFKRERVKNLRRIREEFENEMSRVRDHNH